MPFFFAGKVRKSHILLYLCLTRKLTKSKMEIGVLRSFLGAKVFYYKGVHGYVQQS